MARQTAGGASPRCLEAVVVVVVVQVCKINASG